MRKPPRWGQVLGHGGGGRQTPAPGAPRRLESLGEGRLPNPRGKAGPSRTPGSSEIKIVRRPAQRRTIRPASERVRTLLGHLPPRHKSVAPWQRGRSARWSEDPRLGGRWDGQKVSPRLQVSCALPCRPEGGGDPAVRAPQRSPHGTGPETASLTARPQRGLPSANPCPRHRMSSAWPGTRPSSCLPVVGWAGHRFTNKPTNLLSKK